MGFMVGQDDFVIGRVINETDDHITIEFGKHDDASFRVEPLPGEEATPQFYTAIFVNLNEGRIWKPWRER